jgi:hypothetical protein
MFRSYIMMANRGTCCVDVTTHGELRSLLRIQC